MKFNIKTYFLFSVLLIIGVSIFYRAKNTLGLIPTIAKESPSYMGNKFYVKWDKYDDELLNVTPFGMSDKKNNSHGKDFPEVEPSVNRALDREKIKSDREKENIEYTPPPIVEYTEKFQFDYQGYIGDTENGYTGVLRINQINYPIQVGDTLIDKWHVEDLTSSKVVLTSVGQDTKFVINNSLNINE